MRIQRDAERKVDKIYELLEPNYDYSFSYVELIEAAYLGTRKRVLKVFETLELDIEDFTVACEMYRNKDRKQINALPRTALGYHTESKWLSVYLFLRRTHHIR